MTDPLPRLADALIDLSARLQAISAELRSIEPGAEASPVANQPAFVPHQPPPWSAPAAPSAYPPYPLTPPPPYPAFAPSLQEPAEPPRTGLWERLSREGAGSKVIAWVGGAVTLAGIVLLLVLAIQRGYIGPAPRVALGAVFGLALGAVALRLHANPDNRVGAHALAATAVAALYLDVVAATSLYHYLPAAAGLSLALVVAAGSMAAALRWASQTLATFVVAACALSAPLLTDNRTLLIGFLLVLHIAASPVVVRRRWRALAVVAAVPPVLAVLADIVLSTADGLRLDQDAVTVGTLCLIVGAVQAVAATAAAFGRTNDDEVALGLLLASPVPTLIAAVILPRPAALLLLGGFGLVLLAICLMRRGLRLSRRYADAAAVATLAIAFEMCCIAFRGDVRAIVLLVAAVLLAGLAERAGHVAALGAAGLFACAGDALALAQAARPDRLSVAPVHTIARATVLTAGATGLLMAVSALAVGWATARVLTAPDQATVRTRWTLAAIVALYGASTTVLNIGLAVSPDAHGFLVGHVLVTLSWTLGALVLLLRYVDVVALRVAGLALVAAALAKLVLFDLASLSGIPRVLAFLGAGVVLLAAGARYAKLSAGRGARPVPRLDR